MQVSSLIHRNLRLKKITPCFTPSIKSQDRPHLIALRLQDSYFALIDFAIAIRVRAIQIFPYAPNFA